MIRWVFYPRSQAASDLALGVVQAFESVATKIDSRTHNLSSDEALAFLADGLSRLGFNVERGKRKSDCITVPVLFGLNGKPEKSFQADAHHEQAEFVLEVEAGRGVVNNQFLKDLFQACMMHRVYYLGIAVRNDYRGSDDFDSVCRFFDTLYASDRLELPLKGILIVGY